MATGNSFWRMIPYCKLSFVQIPRFSKMAFIYTPVTNDFKVKTHGNH